MNILVVDDQADIREVLAFIINHELKANIVTAISGNNAVDILKKQSFDVVICDYNMPDGNGLVVHDYIKLSAPQTKFVFCSSEVEEVLNKADNVFFHIKKPNIFDYIKDLKNKLITNSDQQSGYLPEYSEISLHLAKALNPIPCDLYLKLAEKNHVKYFSLEHELTEGEVQGIMNKGQQVLYLKSIDAEKIKSKLINLISKEVTQFSKQESLHASAVIHEYVVKYFQEFGYDSRIQEMAVKNVQQTMNLIMKEKDLDQYLVSLLELSSYSQKLYAVTVCFSATILKSVQLLSDHSLTKMISAIYLQDIFILRSELLPFFTKFEVQDLNWNHSKEEEQFYMHPIKASEFIKKTDSIPPDVDRLIIESHELPSGLGFPRGLTASQISPLSCILILSNLLAREFLRFETAFSTVEYLQFLNRKHGLEQGNFKKIYDASLAIDFFPKK